MLKHPSCKLAGCFHLLDALHESFAVRQSSCCRSSSGERCANLAECSYLLGVYLYTCILRRRGLISNIVRPRYAVWDWESRRDIVWSDALPAR